MWVGWRRLSTESAGVGEKRLWLKERSKWRRTVQCAVIGCKLKQNANEDCNSCTSLAGLVLSFIACFILLVIAPLQVYMMAALRARPLRRWRPTTAFSSLLVGWFVHWFVRWFIKLVVISQQISRSIFQRSRSKFKVKTAVLKMFHL